MKQILATFFWIWGAAGLILVGMEILRMMEKLSTDAGVGTSSFSVDSCHWLNFSTNNLLVIINPEQSPRGP